MKKIIGFTTALVLLSSLCFARGSGLGALSKNLSSLSGSAKTATGTIPEGREILPAIYQAVQPAESEENSKILESDIQLSKIDFGTGSYEIIQSVLIKGKLGKTLQNSKLSVKVDGNNFNVSTLKLTNTAIALDGSKGEAIEASSSGKTQLAKLICDDITKYLESSDEEYAEFAKAAYSDITVVDSIIATSTNALKAKKWVNEHSLELAAVETKFRVSKVDMSKVEGYSYYVEGYIDVGSVFDDTRKSISVHYYTNNDAVADWSASNVKVIKGTASNVKVNYPGDDLVLIGVGKIGLSSMTIKE